MRKFNCIPQLSSMAKLTVKPMMTVILSLILVACVKPKTKSLSELDAEGAGPDAQSAAFYLTEVKGKASITDVKTAWSIPTTALFSFSTCVKDKRTQDAIRYNKFVVIGAESEPHIQTDGDGCLAWTESVAMNFFASEKYITLKRSLRSEGLQRGSRKVSVAVYPWNILAKSNGNDVVDLTLHPDQIPGTQMANDNDAKTLLAGQNPDGSASKHALQVDDMRIWTQDLNTSTRGKDLALTMAFTTKVKIALLGGQKFPYAFTSGQVKVSAALLSIIAQKNGDKLVNVRKVLGKIDSKEFFSADSGTGNFRIQLPLHLDYMTTLGQLELVAKITPLDAPEGLDSFEGVFTVGSFADINGGSSHSTLPKDGEYKTDENQFSYDQYVGQSKAFDRDQMGSGEGEYNPYYFLPLELTRDHVDRQSAETAAHRTINYNVRSCIQNADRSVLNNISFTITKTDGTKLQQKTNDFGCLQWAEKIDNDYYQTEKYVDRTVTMTSDSGFAKQIAIRLDPWDDGSNFARDSRNLAPGLENSVNTAQGTPSRIYLAKFSLEQLHDQYELDKYLNVRKHRTVHISLAPQVERFSSLSGSITKTENLRNGRYLLKYGLRTEPHGPMYPETVVTSHAIVKVQNGVGEQDIDLPIQDIRQANVRSQFYLELYALDESKMGVLSDQDAFKKYQNADDLIDKNSGLQSRTFVGPIQPGLSVSSDSTVRPVDDLKESFCGTTVDCNAMRSIQLGRTATTVSLPFPTDLHLVYANVNQLAAREKVLTVAIQRQNEKMMDPHLFAASMNASVFTLKSPNGSKLMNALRMNSTGMRNLLDGRLDATGVSALCGLWASQVIPQSVAKGASAYGLLWQPSDFYQTCTSYFRPKVLVNPLKVVANGLEMNNPFLIDRKLKVLEMSYQPDSAVNKPLDLVLQTAFTASYTDSVTYGWTGSAGAGANLNLALAEGVSGPGQGNGVGQGLGQNSRGPQAGLGGNIGLNISRNGSSSQATSTAYTVVTQKSLNVDQIQIPLSVSRYQHCALVGLNPNFTKMNIGLFGAFLGMSQDKKSHILTRKILLCDVEETELIVVPETYYFLTTSGTNMTDQGNLNNLPFVAALRGKSDFVKFLAITEGSTSPRDVNKVQSNGDRLYDKSDKAYLNNSTSYPGFITLP